MAVANVYQGKTLIGSLSRTRSGSVFKYDPEFLENLSEEKRAREGAAFHLPYRLASIETSGVNLRSFFAGLLPEGLRLRALVQKVKTSEDDLLSLLIASGSDCIGDIFVLPTDVQPQSSSAKADLGNLSELNFSELFKKSISPEGELDEINIPGGQDKISASMISFPVRGAKDFNSYILKLASKDKPRIIQNEFFFLNMAKDCGLEVNEAEIIKDSVAEEGLLIKRFDRIPKKETKETLRVHQEDSCQFLNRYPADKYILSMSEIAEGLQLCSAPIIELGKLIRLKAFSYLIANGDLHAKNISIYISPKTKLIQLTPAYDLLSTLPYGDQKMALKLDGRDDHLKRTSFLNFGKRFGVRAPAIHAILDEICDVAPRWIKNVDQIGLTEKKTSHLKQVMMKRLRELQND